MTVTAQGDPHEIVLEVIIVSINVVADASKVLTPKIPYNRQSLVTRRFFLKVSIIGSHALGDSV